jgi:hypothetical protein
MMPSYFHQQNQFTTCISASGGCGLRFNRFGIKYPFRRLFDQCNYALIPNLHLHLKSDIVKRLTYDSLIQWDTSDILWIRPEAIRLMFNWPKAMSTPRYDYIIHLKKWVIITKGHLILFPCHSINQSLDSPDSDSSNLHIRTDHTSFQSTHSFKLYSREQWMRSPFRLPSRQTFQNTLFINNMLLKEFACILEATTFFFQGLHKKRLSAFSGQPVFHGLQHDLRNPAIVVENSEKEAIATIYDNRLLNRSSPINERHLPDPRDRSQQLEYPLPSAGMSKPLNRVFQAVKGDEAIIKSISPNYDALSTEKKLGNIAGTDVIPRPVYARRTDERAPAKLSKRRKSWAFYGMNLLLLGLIGYLGFNTYMAFLNTVPDPVNKMVPSPPVPHTSNIPNPSSSSIGGYNAIWQRDLFHVTKEENRNEQENVSFGTLAYADKDVGVVLLGTIVSDDPELSRAIIGDRESKNQEAYREGDAVGKYQIKKIMLGKVIIGTDEGNKLIAVVHKNDRRDPMIEEEKMDPDEAFFKELISEEKQSVRKKRKIRRRRARVSDLKASDE